MAAALRRHPERPGVVALETLNQNTATGGSQLYRRASWRSMPPPENTWHFQTAHHDIYDGDLNAPPMFADVMKNGQRIPAIVQGTKTGLLFFLNRLTGEPIHPVEERKIPPTDALGDAAWPTQPFPIKPEPITRLSMTRDEVSKISPAAEKYCTEIYDQAVQMGPYTPYGMVPRSVPGSTGGGSNDGGAFDPVRRLVAATGAAWARLDNCPPCCRPTCCRRSARRRCRSTTTSAARAIRATRRRGRSCSASTPRRHRLAHSAGEYKADREGHSQTGTATNSGAPFDGRRRLFMGGTADGQLRALDATAGKNCGPSARPCGGSPDQLPGRERQAVAIQGRG